jgi:hypothetical protein
MILDKEQAVAMTKGLPRGEGTKEAKITLISIQGLEVILGTK